MRLSTSRGNRKQHAHERSSERRTRLQQKATHAAHVAQQRTTDAAHAVQQKAPQVGKTVGAKAPDQLRKTGTRLRKAGSRALTAARAHPRPMLAVGGFLAALGIFVRRRLVRRARA
ncbi:hypothetical protein [Actinopolymorpha alba]|uniref:hypothetical protein n=1 Tax=Actinopolymorpha alba TaxID=533267 RepID=UPI0003820629|nr:hypothetical protein [Actinopolymorpha alba]